MKKSLWTLNIDNYSPEITSVTYPLMERYALRIGAEFNIITKREYLTFPVVYEKMQIHNIGRDYDWNIYFDSDVAIHPDLFDVTDYINKDTVMFHTRDMASYRWTYDEYFRRDGRNIGACNWFAVASDWCLDLWKPLDDLSFDQAVRKIQVIQLEKELGIRPEHLIDDYTLSRNIARFGLKHQTFQDVLAKLGESGKSFFWHRYDFPTEQKVEMVKVAVRNWGLMAE